MVPTMHFITEGSEEQRQERIDVAQSDAAEYRKHDAAERPLQNVSGEKRAPSDDVERVNVMLDIWLTNQLAHQWKMLQTVRVLQPMGETSQKVGHPQTHKHCANRLKHIFPFQEFAFAKALKQPRCQSVCDGRDRVLPPKSENARTSIVQ